MKHPLSPRLGAILLAIALAGGACGATTDPSSTPGAGASASPSVTAVDPSTGPSIAATPSPDPTPSPTPVVTAQPAPTPSPAATPSAAPATASPATGLPAGRTGKVHVPGVGLTLVIPKGWRTIDLSAGDLQAIIDILPEGTLPNGWADQAASLVAGGMRLFAVDTRPSNRGANVNVLEPPSPGLVLTPGMLKTVVQLGLSQLPSLRNPRLRDVTVDGHDAVRVDYNLSMTVLGTNAKSIGTQLWIIGDTGLIIVTISTPKGGDTDARDRIIKSLRLD